MSILLIGDAQFFCDESVIKQCASLWFGSTGSPAQREELCLAFDFVETLHPQERIPTRHTVASDKTPRKKS
ncbi:MAG: hypothetical protein MUC87_21705 [Bacteroidia bacterium]|nr:hypothetical protein [Bacteroidia bacterium]